MANYNIPNNLNAGNHTLKIEASADGLTTSTEIPFTINELLEKPVVKLVLDPNELFAYNTVHIDGSTSYQENGSIIKYEWSTGETTPEIDLKLGNSDTEITLTVTGEDSQRSSLTYPISIIPNNTILNDNEVLKQNENYPNYFADKLGKFELNNDFNYKNGEIRLEKGKNCLIELRNQNRTNRGIDNLSFTLGVPNRSKESLSSAGYFGKIYFKNGFVISLSMYHYLSDTKCIFETPNGKVIFTFAGDSYNYVYNNYNIHQVKKQLVITRNESISQTINISNQEDLGGIVKIEIYNPASKNASADVDYFFTGCYVSLSNLLLKEIKETENPIITCTTNNPDAIDYGTVCTLTAESDQFINSYLWNTGETTKTIQITPNKTTEYSCTITNDSGLSGIGYITQEVKPYFPVAIIGANGLNNNLLKVGNTELAIIKSESYSPVNLSLSYKWYLNDELISTNKNIRLMNKSGTVKLVIEDELGNTEETSITIKLIENPSKKNIDLKNLKTYDIRLKKFVKTDIIPEASLSDINNLFN